MLINSRFGLGLANISSLFLHSLVIPLIVGRDEAKFTGPAGWKGKRSEVEKPGSSIVLHVLRVYARSWLMLLCVQT